MKLVCEQSVLMGTTQAPGSVAHTLRALALAACSPGESLLTRPADTPETQAFARALNLMGVSVQARAGCWQVSPTVIPAPDDVVTLGDAPRPLLLALGHAMRITQGVVLLTGGPTLRRLPLDGLMTALTDLGGQAWSTRGNGCAPLVAGGPLRGGQTQLESPSGEELSSLLLAAAGCPDAVTIVAPHLDGVQETELTLGWLRRQGIVVEQEGWHTFHLPGGQHPRPIHSEIPGDFPVAAALLAMGALGRNAIEVTGVDLADGQPEKAVVHGMHEMGAQVVAQKGRIAAKASTLHGTTLDLGATPSALPLLAILACFAEGTTRLVNVPPARAGEVDPVQIMATGIKALGGKVSALDRGLEITGAPLTGAQVSCAGHAGVAMAFMTAGLSVPGRTVIMGYGPASGECAACVGLTADLGGRITTADEHATPVVNKEVADLWETTSS